MVTPDEFPIYVNCSYTRERLIKDSYSNLTFIPLFFDENWERTVRVLMTLTDLFEINCSQNLTDTCDSFDVSVWQTSS